MLLKTVFYNETDLYTGNCIEDIYEKKTGCALAAKAV